MHADDNPEERDFLKRVREECELEVYDVTGDYREMIMQFGQYLITECDTQRLTHPRLSYLVFRRLATYFVVLLHQQLG